MFSLTIKQKYVKNQNFHGVVFELQAWKGQKKGIFDLFWRCRHKGLNLFIAKTYTNVY